MRWFSWKETAATLAMLAFVTVTATLYLTRRGETPRSDEHSVTVATVSEVKPTPGPAPTEIALQGGGELPALQGHRAVRAPVRLAVPVNTGGSRPVAVAAQVEIGGAQEILIYQPGRSGQPGLSRSVIVPRHGQVTWGAQMVGVQQAAATRPAPSHSAVETF
jgi:hypothetical protein